MKIENIKSAYFIGIGGAGMSTIAELFISKNIKVCGSDLVLNEKTERLKKLGAKINDNQNGQNITSDFDVVIIAGKAIKNDNPEFIRANELKIKIIERSDALFLLTENKKIISVTGSHGKTTVSSMLAQSIYDAGVDLSFAVGGELVKFNSGAHLGKSEYFLIEADESDASFLKYKPHISVITNVEPDHLDFYDTKANYINAFKKYISKTTKKLFINQENKNLILKNAGFDVELFDNADNYYETNCRIVEKVLKEFNVNKISFNGTKRRFELKGEKNNIKVYDDYAHHPTEITSLVNRAKTEFPNSKINVVFEPHLFSRTKNFAADFAKALSKADNVALVDIYPAREKPIENVTSEIIKVGKYFDNWDKAVDYIVNISNSGDIIFTVGAGTITKMSTFILEKL